MDLEMLSAINQIELDIERNQEAHKQTKEEVDSKIEELDEFAYVQSAKEDLKAANLKLKIAMGDDGAITAGLEQMATIKADIKDLQDILSHHLIRYFADTANTQLPVAGDDTKAQDIIINAKLGPVIQYQEKLDFNPSK